MFFCKTMMIDHMGYDFRGVILFAIREILYFQARFVFSPLHINRIPKILGFLKPNAVGNYNQA